MAGNPVLGFLSANTTGTTPRDVVTKNLRWLGIAGLVWFVVNAVGRLLAATMGTAYLDTGVAAVNTVSAIIGIVISALITAAILFWITYTINAWTNGQANGSTHALVIGILATVLGAIGVLGGLAGVGFAASPLYGSGVSVVAMLVGVLTLAVSAFELYCGVMILTNRGKATGTGGNATGTTN